MTTTCAMRLAALARLTMTLDVFDGIGLGERGDTRTDR